MINENDNNKEKVEVENNNEIEIEKNEIYKGVILIKEYKSISDNINYPNIEGIYTFKVQISLCFDKKYIPYYNLKKR